MRLLCFYLETATGTLRNHAISRLVGLETMESRPADVSQVMAKIHFFNDRLPGAKDGEYRRRFKT